MAASKDNAPAEAKPRKPTLSELQDELELLKAQGNPNPARLAEVKKLISEG
jgi:hypothetical protein